MPVDTPQQKSNKKYSFRVMDYNFQKPPTIFITKIVPQAIKPKIINDHLNLLKMTYTTRLIIY
jgi:hypothetical protein